MKQALKSFVRQAFGASRGAAARRAPQAAAPLRTLDRRALRAVSGGTDGGDLPKGTW
jgi:hypothetical protein